MITTLHTYVPQDRLRALSRGESLPDRTTGSALFADISGFTPLTETLHNSLGPRRGAEELTRHLDTVYTALIAQVEKYGGSVIAFAGDAIMCWFDEIKDDSLGLSGGMRDEASSLSFIPPPSALAVACALAMQEQMRGFAAIPLPDGTTTTLAVKVTIATGPARRFLVGDPTIQYLDTIAGATIARTATAEHIAHKGEILVDEPTANALENAPIQKWRAAENGERFALLNAMALPDEAVALQGRPDRFLSGLPDVPDQELRRWVPPAVYERQIARREEFLTEFRPCVALFVHFGGIDYDADGAQAQLDAFIRRAQEIVGRYEGALLQLTIGDKGSYLFIIFGALTAHEDDARRAVKTALELRNMLAPAVLAPLQIGITHGIMRVGAYGGPTRRTYGAQSDEVNLAARLMQNAAAGEILVSGLVHQATADDFVFEPRPPLSVKGKTEPLPVFAVNGERRHRAIRLQEPAYTLPMVGREQELEIVNEKLEIALTGKSQIIGITAEAGMGKSRLVAQVIRSARKKGFTGFGGAAQADSINTPFLAWKPIWSAFFRIDPELPPRKQIRSLEEELQDRVPERVQALPLLSPLLDIPIPENDFTRTLEPKYRASTLYALVQDCLCVAALEESPLLIVIEDLHWMDALSHDLLEELVRALTDSRICFVLAYRPPRLARLQTPRIQAMPNFTQIALHELNQAESAQAIRAKLAQLYPAHTGAVPPALVERLMSRAQGNPFFLEELLNYLRDRGLDALDPTALNKIELPDSLHTLILSRIDQLSEREKLTLRVASIVGRLFRVAWLTGYYPELGAFHRVQTELDELAQLDITPLDTPEPELAYLFKHIITHEVTYESLPFATRSKLHEQLAQFLEQQIAGGVIHESPLLGALVYHYMHSENRVKQREYLRRAVQAALRVSAFTTAVEYLTRLVELTPHDDPTCPTLTLELADAIFQLNDFDAARTAIARAQTAASTDTERAAVLTLQIEMASLLGDYSQAQTLLAQSVPLARAGGDDLTLCRALYASGDLHWRMGDLENARTELEASCALARKLGDVTRELFALNRLALVLGQQGNLGENERLLHQVHTRAVTTGNREREMTALNNLGVMAVEREDYAAAREYTWQALALAREIGVQDVISLALLNLADIDNQLGQFPAARIELHEGLLVALRMNAVPRKIQALKTAAYLAQSQGQTEGALMFWGLARTRAEWTSEDQNDLTKTLDKWALNPSLVEQGLAKGAGLHWEETIQELLKG